jgi:hypothetical protein
MQLRQAKAKKIKQRKASAKRLFVFPAYCRIQQADPVRSQTKRTYSEEP